MGQSGDSDNVIADGALNQEGEDECRAPHPELGHDEWHGFWVHCQRQPTHESPHRFETMDGHVLTWPGEGGGYR